MLPQPVSAQTRRVGASLHEDQRLSRPLGSDCVRNRLQERGQGALGHRPDCRLLFDPPGGLGPCRQRFHMLGHLTEAVEEADFICEPSELRDHDAEPRRPRLRLRLTGHLLHRGGGGLPHMLQPVAERHDVRSKAIESFC